MKAKTLTQLADEVVAVLDAHEGSALKQINLLVVVLGRKAASFPEGSPERDAFLAVEKAADGQVDRLLDLAIAARDGGTA